MKETAHKKTEVERGYIMDRNKIDELLELTRINEMIEKKEAANAKKPSNIILWCLAVFGAIAAVATIAYLVFDYMIPDYDEDYDYDDDDFDDFEDDFVDLDLEK